MKNEERFFGIDLPTLAAISSLAWILVNVSHEIIGHAGSAFLLGIPVRAVSTTTASIQGELQHSTYFQSPLTVKPQASIFGVI